MSVSGTSSTGSSKGLGTLIDTEVERIRESPTKSQSLEPVVQVEELEPESPLGLELEDSAMSSPVGSDIPFQPARVPETYPILALEYDRFEFSLNLFKVWRRLKVIMAKKLCDWLQRHGDNELIDIDQTVRRYWSKPRPSLRYFLNKSTLDTVERYVRSMAERRSKARFEEKDGRDGDGDDDNINLKSVDSDSEEDEEKNGEEDDGNDEGRSEGDDKGDDHVDDDNDEDDR